MEKKFWVRSGRFYPFGTRHHYFEEGQDILKTKTGVKLVSQCNIYSKLSFFCFFLFLVVGVLGIFKRIVWLFYLLFTVFYK